ncbi:MAG: hypothetical protein AAF702_40690 [Chloroflexota bacterium]
MASNREGFENETIGLNMALVSPSVWRPLTAQSLTGLGDHERLLAQTIVTSFHNRHVGVSPDLAAGLAQLLLDPSKMMNPPEPWGAVLKRLKTELGFQDDRPERSEQGLSSASFGFAFFTNPTYSALRIFMPLLLTICRQVGESYLFCADEVDDGISKGDYLAYAQTLADAVQTVAASEDDQYQIFWKERAITLSSLTRPSERNHAQSNPLPEMDPVALRLLLTLNPSLSTAQTAKKLPRLVTPLNRQRSLTRKEGGVDGVHMTRRIEDINNILISELLNPTPVLADRILNTGFLAIERPPERVKLRDVLIAALMPADVQQGMSADFLKACWFDCLMHLSVLLRQHKLHQSEFRWIEGDSFDRVRSSVYHLGNLPIFDVDTEEEATEGYRQQFLNALQWLPTYLDRRSPFRPLPEPIMAASEEQLVPLESSRGRSRHEQIERWVTAAWSQQEESAAWRTQQPISSRASDQQVKVLAVDEFAFVHVMLFLPATLRYSEFRRFTARSTLLKKLLRLGNSAAQHVSITWVPEHIAPNRAANRATVDKNSYAGEAEVPDLDPFAETDGFSEDPNQWAFETRGRGTGALFPGELNDMDGKEIAQVIENAWFEQLLKEMWRD